MVHSLFSIVAPVVGHDPVEVRERDLAFGEVAGVHFASVVVFEGPAGDAAAEFPRYVVLESCIDGAVDDHLEALVFAPERRAAVAALFSSCQGFDDVRLHPPESELYRKGLVSYLKDHVCEPELFHIGSPGLRVDHITSGAALRVAFDREIRRVNLTHEPPLRIAEEMRSRLRVPDSSTKTHWHLDARTAESGDYAWFSDRVDRWPSRLVHWGKLGLAAIGIAAVVLGLFYWLWTLAGVRTVLLGLAGAVGAFWGVNRWMQGRHPPSDIDAKALRALTEQEDHGLHNHMASLALLKPGRFRRIAIRVVLRGLNLVYRTWFTDITPGRLMGLPTIHFAQWSIIPLPPDLQGRRREALLFLSNYDGSWESYLDDFLSHLLYPGVIAIWSNAVTFPSPLNGRIFKDWARTRMSPHAVWDDKRYPVLSVSNIQNNERLRLGLFSPPRTDHEARLWLARLGATMSGDEEFDEVAGPLPTHDMQGLVLRGYGTLPHAAYALLRIGDADAARRWLQDLIGEITDARELDKRDRARETHAVNVAFTCSALETLGVSPAIRERFPLVFREGIAPTPGGAPLHHRSRILGDINGSEPEGWVWGGRGDPTRRVDVLLMMFAETERELDAVQQRRLRSFVESGAGQNVHVIVSDPSNGLTPHHKTIDHFGFVDGISQPQIEGTWHAGRRLEEGSTPDVLKPGEFVLGYQSGDGSTTPGVPVERTLDPGGLLPPTAGDTDLRDFGRNGTFLVARQLAQHVADFRRFTAQAAAVSPSAYASHAADVVAARIVGRWRSGTPLIEPAAPGDPNAFSYVSDPLGFQCPIGAHIRRANPRDSLLVDRAAAQASANRHRLLRRGRPYGRPLPEGELHDDGKPRGMMFICLNADIERQFEFVQQNWINNPTFGGLYTEQDPLVGAICPPAHLTVQANAVCQRLDGLSRFVTVRGGGYFFLPGMSALRYLARLDPRALPQSPAESQVSSLAPPRQSVLRGALTTLARALPFAGAVWAMRFPLLLAALLLLLPLSASWLPRVVRPMLFTSALGAIVIGLLASTAAWTAMVTLRLVLMYGTRVGLQRPRWTGPARWRHVLAFQLLALPVVIGAVHYTALDSAGAGNGVSYWQVASSLAWGSAAGLALGMLVLSTATAIQSLRPGGRAGLFAPPLPILNRIVKRISRLPLIDRVSAWISRGSEAIVGSVPEKIGVGYIDYRRRRLLPGHAFAAVLATLVLVVYLAGFFFLDPSRNGNWQPPSVAYVLFMLIAIGWILSAASFFLDRYRLPTLPAVAIWIIAVATIAGTDHTFDVAGPIEQAATPAQIMAAQQHGGGKVIVVASEGYALASSAWTAEVLTRLAEGPQGRQFADAVRLISASSGATLGTTHFVNGYRPDGFDASSTLAIRANASAPASSQGWWGLVYPDLMRALLPVVVPARADRGWAIEQAWKRAFSDGRGPSLSAWRQDVARGWRPATVFGVTSAETGERGLLATYLVRTSNSRPADFVTSGRDVDVVTAARLSAGFPYVSPIPRAATDSATSLHFTDGGFWDNSGVLPVLEWIEDAQQSGKVLLIEIRSSPRRERPPPESMPWMLEAIGPLRTLVEVRYDGHAARTEEALRRFMLVHPVEHVIFTLEDARVPFTWNLGKTDLRYIAEAWNRGVNREATERVRAYLNEQ